MKQFNIGDKVTVRKYYQWKDGIYMGIYEDKDLSYHRVSYPNAGDQGFFSDEEIELVASVTYIPVAKFHKGEFASWIDNVVSTVMILEDRNDKMQYKCYHPQMDIVYILESELRAVGDNA